MTRPVGKRIVWKSVAPVRRRALATSVVGDARPRDTVGARDDGDRRRRLAYVHLTGEPASNGRKDEQIARGAQHKVTQ